MLRKIYVALYAEYFSSLDRMIAVAKRYTPDFIRINSRSVNSRSELSTFRRIALFTLRILVFISFPVWSIRALVKSAPRDTSPFETILENYARGTFASQSQAKTINASRVFRRSVSPSPRSVIFFAPINYKFRFQRPQQLSQILTSMGYRVFYVNPEILISNQAKDYIAVENFNNISVLDINLRAISSYISIKPIDNRSAKSVVFLLEELLAKENVGNTTLIFQQPGWFNIARLMSGNQIIFDCMDFHIGFDNVPDEMELLDREIAKMADLVTVTSPWLKEYIERISGRESILIRNGCDFKFFNQTKGGNHEEIVIGYFGAIAEWFDFSFIREIALGRPDIRIELIGNVTTDEIREVNKLKNVVLLGEVPYHDLPKLIAKWRLGIIPFKITPLIQATNAVKMYEYASAGLQIISSRIPEIEIASSETPGIHVVDSKEDILPKLEIALHQADSISSSLQSWASKQTWKDRGAKLVDVLQNQTKVSVIVLMWNKASLTIRCLKSVIERSGYENLEIILVDNASEIHEHEIVQNWINLNGYSIIVLRNESNLGFAGGNNVGIRASLGDYVVLLNNDTEVTLGWVWKALRHFRNEQNLGLLGPSTNNSGNEARITLRLPENDWLEECFFRFNLRSPEIIDVRTLAFFCVFIPREIISTVGLLDEDFGRGYFEDDDYCRRVESKGHSIKIARDIFVYHEMGASFNTLGHLEQNRLFIENKRRYEDKWGKWIPHAYASDSDQ